MSLSTSYPRGEMAPLRCAGTSLEALSWVTGLSCYTELHTVAERSCVDSERWPFPRDATRLDKCSTCLAHNAFQPRYSLSWEVYHNVLDLSASFDLISRPGKKMINRTNRRAQRDNTLRSKSKSAIRNKDKDKLVNRVWTSRQKSTFNPCSAPRYFVSFRFQGGTVTRISFHVKRSFP